MKILRVLALRGLPLPKGFEPFWHLEVRIYPRDVLGSETSFCALRLGSFNGIFVVGLKSNSEVSQYLSAVL